LLFIFLLHACLAQGVLCTRDSVNEAFPAAQHKMQKGPEIEAKLNPKQLRELLKKGFSHVTPDTEEFQRMLLAPVDEVVVAYEDFFKAVARNNSKLNKAHVVRGLQTLIKGDVAQLGLFAEKLVQGQRHCWNKSKQVTTGEKLQDAVARVALVYKKGPLYEMPSSIASTSGSSQSISSLCDGPKPAGLDLEDAKEELQKAMSLWGPPSPTKATKQPVADSPMSIASSDAGAEKAWAPSIRNTRGLHGILHEAAEASFSYNTWPGRPYTFLHYEALRPHEVLVYIGELLAPP